MPAGDQVQLVVHMGLRAPGSERGGWHSHLPGEPGEVGGRWVTGLGASERKEVGKDLQEVAGGEVRLCSEQPRLVTRTRSLHAGTWDQGHGDMGHGTRAIDSSEASSPLTRPSGHQGFGFSLTPEALGPEFCHQRAGCPEGRRQPKC